MSIINEALKKAEREGQKVLNPPERNIAGSFKMGFPKVETGRAKFAHRQWKVLVLGGSILFSLIVIWAGFARFRASQDDTSLKGTSEIVLVKSPQIDAREDLPIISGSEPALQEEEIVKALPSLNLNGIIYGSDASYAIINNKIVKEDDLVEQIKVLKIYKDRVLFNFENREYILKAR